jgi:class 3 adenylate cyclase
MDVAALCVACHGLLHTIAQKLFGAIPLLVRNDKLKIVDEQRPGRTSTQCSASTLPTAWDNRLRGRFDYAAIGTVSNVASRLCDEAKPGQILISPRVLTKVENAVKVEPVGEFELKGIRRPLAAYNVVAAA